MAFKQRSSGPFKMMGSSPAKQVKGKFNFTGAGASTTPKYNTTKAAKKSTSIVQSLIKPGATDATKSIGPKNTIKSELKKGSKRFVESAKGQWKGFKVPKVASKIVKAATTLGKVARAVGKASQAGLLVEAGYQAYKSGQKHSDGKVNKNQKSFMSDAKKNTKSVWKK